MLFTNLTAIGIICLVQPALGVKRFYSSAGCTGNTPASAPVYLEIVTLYQEGLLEVFTLTKAAKSISLPSKTPHRLTAATQSVYSTDSLVVVVLLLLST